MREMPGGTSESDFLLAAGIVHDISSVSVVEEWGANNAGSNVLYI